MEIIVAKNAGFCFGVKRAFKIAKELREKYPDEKLYTYGPLIHNPLVIEDLESKNIYSSDDLNIDDSDKLLIRAHGVSPLVKKNAISKGMKIFDATCPLVTKVHRIVEKAIERGEGILIIGDKKHPEIIGVLGVAGGNAKIINSIEEAKSFKTSEKICVIAQTTLNEEHYDKIISELQKCNENLILKNTICAATSDRQRELRKLADLVDFTIVFGGKNSSNTKKLYEILIELGKKAIHIERKSEICFKKIEKYDKIGIAAGASTPDKQINELVEYLLAKKNTRS